MQTSGPNPDASTTDQETARAVALVQRYLTAVGERDQQAARRCLADKNFGYISPIARFDDADRFAESIAAVGAILQRIEVRQRFTDGCDVCHILDVTVAVDAYKTQTVVHLARVANNRIQRLEVVFDGSDYHRMIEQDEAPQSSRLGASD
jgi:hypothetical protein